MMILGLELENVKSYDEAKLEFTPGVNAIVGHNGAGKSTIVEAIGFTLFNFLNYSQAEFIRSGAKSATMTVAFLSAIDERRYEVTRRIGSTSQIFVYDPELDTRICEGRADVDRFLYEHLCMEPGTDLRALFADAVGVPQGTLTAAFLHTETNRRTIFDRLLQLEDYRTASDKLREPGRLLRERRGELDTKIAGAAARLERLEPLLADIAQDKATLARLEETQARLRKELETTSQQRAGMETAQTEAQSAQQALSQAEQKVATLTQQVETAAAALAEAEAAQATVAKNQSGYEAYAIAQKEQAELDAQADARRRLSEQLAEIDKQVAVQQAAVQRAEEELSEIQAAEATVARLAEPVRNQQALEEKLTQAQNEAARLEAAQKQANEYQSAIERIQKRREQLQKALAESTKLETKRTETEAALDSLNTSLNEKRAELAGLKPQAEAVKEQSKVLAQEFALCPVCEQPLEETQRQSLLTRNQAEVERLRGLYAKINGEVKTQEDKLEELRQLLKQLNATLRNAPRAEELARLEEELATAQRQHQDAHTTVEALRGADETIARLKRQLTELGDPKQQHAVAAARAAQRQTTAQKQQAATQQLAQAQAQAESTRRELAAYADLDDRLARVRAELRTHTAAYQAVLGHRQLAQQVEARRTAQAEWHAQLTAAQAREAEQRKVAAEAAARFDADAYTKIREQEQELRTQLGVQESEARHTRERLERQEIDVQTLQTLAHEAEKMRTRQADLLAQEKALEKIRTLLRQAQPYIAKALVQRVSESAEQIFGDIMQDYSRHLQWGEDYGITLRVDEHDRQFAQLSGGEQMSAALAVRLALLREMSNIEVAFFDEPTANLDESRRESLARQILQVRGFRQLFVISHDDTFEQATQNVIRVERINGSSRAYI